MTKRKFTSFILAEVLITLTIIGVIAALTIPTLIKNYQREQWKTGLKKAYSTLNAAYQQLSSDEGFSGDTTQIRQTWAFKPLFIKYLKTAKDCGQGDTACVTADNTYNYRNFNNKSEIGTGYLDDGQFILQDGSFIFIENQNTNLLMVSIDVNGYQKAPNRWGYDLFTFEITKEGKFLPSGASGTEFNNPVYCSVSNNSKYNGVGCTYNALTDPEYFKKLP